LMANGFIVGTARDNVIRLLPPYVTPKKAFVEFVAALEKVLTAQLSVVSSPLSPPGPAIEGVVKPGHHGTTFGGNPIACRLGIAVLDEIHHGRLLERVTQCGDWFGAELRKLQSRMPMIVDIRGIGFMWGIELDRPAKPVANELMANGFIVGTARDNVIRLLPPYVTPKKAFLEFIAALEQVLASAKEKAA
ncbi:MAG TPA: aminotransferase class III-fold pyridoxal phosphate-dependent enzyme, partial [Thermoanaerobaculia bacterium]